MSQLMTRPLPQNTIIMVSGVSFRQDAVRRVVEGDEVVIRHDQRNEFDAYACQVATLTGDQLGFVPAGLAPRLAAVHPGGVWRARVKEVLRGDTWGLRVAVGPLITEGYEDAGQRAGGLRHRGDALIEDSNGQQALAPPPDPTTPPAPTGKVFTKTGRALGTLVGREGDKVRVLTPDGRSAAYPASIVVVRA